MTAKRTFKQVWYAPHIFLRLLPLIEPSLIWLAMPVTEFVVAIYVVVAMRKYTQKLPKELPDNSN